MIVEHFLKKNSAVQCQLRYAICFSLLFIGILRIISDIY